MEDEKKAEEKGRARNKRRESSARKRWRDAIEERIEVARNDSE